MSIKTPYLIAEISCNHSQKFNYAKKLILTAKQNGADAVKLQTYTANSMTLKGKKFKIRSGIWKNLNLWQLYNNAKTPLEWHKELFDYAKKINITIFSTPFDEMAVDFLEKLNCPIYKVASFEMNDHHLIKKIAITGKPMIISTGMANLDEISEAYQVAKKNGCKDITLLYCVSSYPSQLNDFNINNIKILKDKFKCKIGFSDHSNDNSIVASAVSAGAEVFEKHIKLNKKNYSFDEKFSLNGKEFKKYSQTINFNYNLLGKKYFFRNNSENKYKVFRRSIYAIANIKKGEKFTKKNIKTLRPCLGIEANYFPFLLNKKSPKNYKFGEVISKRVLKKLQ